MKFEVLWKFMLTTPVKLMFHFSLFLELICPIVCTQYLSPTKKTKNWTHSINKCMGLSSIITFAIFLFPCSTRVSSWTWAVVGMDATHGHQITQFGLCFMCDSSRFNPLDVINATIIPTKPTSLNLQVCWCHHMFSYS